MAKTQEKLHRQSGLLAAGAVLASFIGVSFSPLYVSVYHPRFIYICGYKQMWIPAVVGLVLSIIAIVKINRVPKPHRRNIIRSSSILIAFITSAMIISSVLRPTEDYRLANRTACQRHLNDLGKTMILYAYENNNGYPDPKKWCDILFDSRKALLAEFLCSDIFTVEFMSFKYSYPKPKKGRSHYAMNKNCRFDSDPDTVLLFDAKSGWNMSGGAELLTLNNHDGKGCNVFFNDGRVEFVKRGEVKNLNWGQ